MLLFQVVLAIVPLVMGKPSFFGTHQHPGPVELWRKPRSETKNQFCNVTDVHAPGAGDPTLTELQQLSKYQLDEKGGVRYDWENLLIGAPHAICLISQLVVLGSMSDYQLHQGPNVKVEHLKNAYPHFGPVIAFLGDEAMLAFQKARENMLRLANNFQAIMSTSEQSIVLLKSEGVEPLEAVKIQANYIDKYMNESIQLSIDTQGKFIHVQNIIIEILRLARLTDKEKKLEQERVEQELEQLTRYQAVYNESLGRVKDAYAKAQEMEEEAKNAVETAIGKISTAWETFGRQMVGVLVNGLVSLVPMVTKAGVLGAATMAVGSAVETISVAATKKSAEHQQAGSMDLRIDALANVPATLIGCDESISAFLENGKTLVTNASSENGKRILNASGVKGAGEILSLGLRTAKNAILKLNMPEQAESYQMGAADIVQKGIDHLVNLLNVEADDIAFNFLSDVLKELGNYKPELKGKIAEGTSLRAQLGADPKLPVQSQRGSEVENEVHIANLRQQAYISSQKHRIEQRESMKNEQLMLVNITSRIARGGSDIRDITKVLELLRQALGYLENLSAQWAGLVKYFTEVATMTHALGRDVERYVPYLQNSKSTLDDVIRNMLLCNGVKIFQISCGGAVKRFLKHPASLQADSSFQRSKYLYMITKIYKYVSDEYLMKPITSATQLGLLKKEEKEAALGKVAEEAKIASMKIQEFIDIETDNYEKRLTEGIEEQKKVIADASKAPAA